MTDDEIRIAIAESVGWQWWEFPDGKGVKFYQIVGPGETNWQSRHKGIKCERPPLILSYANDVPNYTEDLGAMHEVIAALAPKYRHAYAIILGGMVWQPPNTRGWQDWRDTLLASEATARQRAEAYLRTIGKWKE